MSTTATAKKTATPAAKGATLASMAKAADKAAETPAETKAPAPVMNWEQDFQDVRVVVYTRNERATKDLEKETPAFVKTRVNDAYTASLESAAKGEKSPVWLHQPLPSAEYVAEFIKLARRYAAFKGYTLRTPAKRGASEDLTLAVFAVKPKEERKRAPKSETVPAAK